MTHRPSSLPWAWVAAALLWAACDHDPQPPPQPLPPLQFEVPSNFPDPTYRLALNTPTEAGIELGRRLFYDPILSADSSISCGSCHIQYSAFSHHGHALSHGIDDRLGTRNAPGIINAAWQTSFFWDGGVFDLDLVPPVPIHNPDEMGYNVADALARLQRHPQYPAAFEAAFGSPGVDGQRFLKAMSQFMLVMISANAPYDRALRNQGPPLPPEAQRGLALYRQHCATCHATDLFTDHSFRNNGIQGSFFRDKGRGLITLDPADAGKFKVPTLRNLTFTAPYMHDGSFRSLEEVLRYYSEDIPPSPGLDPALPVGGFRFSASQQADLLAFFRSLDDTAFIRDPRLSE